MTTMTATQVTYHEVIWGDDEEDRMAYVDHHDGSFLSSVAAVDAHRQFLSMQRQGRRVILSVAGQAELAASMSAHKLPYYIADLDLRARWFAGEDFPAQPQVVAVEHKTRTVLNAFRGERYVTKSNGSCGRWVDNDDSVALCSCGWKWHAGSRAEARGAARVHRQEAA
ncbi:hypothetical protein ACWKSP_22120 [Micromonosporaceae bacterium Da 78-11]